MAATRSTSGGPASARSSYSVSPRSRKVKGSLLWDKNSVASPRGPVGHAEGQAAEGILEARIAAGRLGLPTRQGDALDRPLGRHLEIEGLRSRLTREACGEGDEAPPQGHLELGGEEGPADLRDAGHRRPRR